MVRNVSIFMKHPQFSERILCERFQFPDRKAIEAELSDLFELK